MNEEIQKLAERIKVQDSRISALEKFVRELATEALGDSPKTASFLNRLAVYRLEQIPKATCVQPHSSFAWAVGRLGGWRGNNPISRVSRVPEIKAQWVRYARTRSNFVGGR